jgi:5-methylcytosine-specific restriction protein A
MSPRRALAPCTQPGCPVLTDRGRCHQHRREADQARGTATERGYTGRGHQRFRRAVLRRDPICVDCRRAPATVADHHPLSRRDLLAAGLDPDDPAHGRGLCTPCHNRHTARAQPGGWNQPGGHG